MRTILLFLLCLILATTAWAQSAQRPSKRQDTPAKRADRMVKLLELPDRRMEATAVLLRLGADSVPALMRGLNDPRPEVFLPCMQVLRELGPVAKAALPKLETLAKNKDLKIAHAARWASSRLAPRGTTLIADYTKSCVRLLDPAGKTLLTVPDLKSVWDVERLANGNFLATLYTQNNVREVDVKGKVIWEYTKAKMPLDADRLANGNTLISESGGNQVVEVDTKGKVVWKYAAGSPYDADRLPSGNTLITEFNTGRVIEVDPKGKIVWKITVSQPFGADRLPNGNTLITLHGAGEVREVDPKGKVVFRLRNLKSPNEARRLPNGHTLVAESSMIREFDKDGKEVSRVSTARLGTVHRY